MYRPPNASHIPITPQVYQQNRYSKFPIPYGHDERARSVNPYGPKLYDRIQPPAYGTTLSFQRTTQQGVVHKPQDSQSQSERFTRPRAPEKTERLPITAPASKKKEPDVCKAIRFKSRSFPDTQVVFLCTEGKISLQGTFRMRLLEGLVYCYGYVYRPSADVHTMFSPSNSVALDLCDVPSEIALSADDKALRSVIRQPNLVFRPRGGGCGQTPRPLMGTPYARRKLLKGGTVELDLCQEDCDLLNRKVLPMYAPSLRGTVFLVQRNESKLIRFFNNAAPSYPLAKDVFGHYDEGENVLFSNLCVTFNAECSLQVTPAWCEMVDHISCWKAPVVLLLGQSNVGKSTLGRYLSNRLLNVSPKVAFLECDVGQCEFTPSGIVALNLLDRPVTGPPFSHQRDPVLAHFFGECTPSTKPDLYLRCVRSLVKFYRENLKPNHPNLPLIVNTCGWLTDMGAALALDIIRICKPSHIVRLRSFSESSSTRKLLPELDSDFIQNAPGFRTQGSGMFWKPLEPDSDSEGGEESQDGQPGDATRLWSRHDDTAQDLRRIFEVSGFFNDDATEGEDNVEEERGQGNGEGLEEGELPVKKKRKTSSKEEYALVRSQLPGKLWRKTGGIEVCTLLTKQWSKRSGNLRSLAQLAYFSKFFSVQSLCASYLHGNPSLPEPSPAVIPDWPVYRISFTDVAVQSLRCEVPRSTMLYCFYRSIVALAKVDQSEIVSFEDQFPGMVKFVHSRHPIAEYIGLGFVYHCDVNEKEFLISTPLEEAAVRRVNLLLLGRNEVPDFFQHPQEENPPHFLENFPDPLIAQIRTHSIKQSRSEHQ